MRETMMASASVQNVRCRVREKEVRADLENETETIKNYRERARQCEAVGEYAIAENIREILLDEQDHLIDLATALGEDAPDMSG